MKGMAKKKKKSTAAAAEEVAPSEAPEASALAAATAEDTELAAAAEAAAEDALLAIEAMEEAGVELDADADSDAAEEALLAIEAAEEAAEAEAAAEALLATAQREAPTVNAPVVEAAKARREGPVGGRSRTPSTPWRNGSSNSTRARAPWPKRCSEPGAAGPASPAETCSPSSRTKPPVRDRHRRDGA